jgi:hypothetical protein
MLLFDVEGSILSYLAMTVSYDCKMSIDFVPKDKITNTLWS